MKLGTHETVQIGLGGILVGVAAAGVTIALMSYAKSHPVSKNMQLAVAYGTPVALGAVGAILSGPLGDGMIAAAVAELAGGLTMQASGIVPTTSGAIIAHPAIMHIQDRYTIVG